MDKNFLSLTFSNDFLISQGSVQFCVRVILRHIPLLLYFLSFTHNFAVLSSQISMNAKVDLYMVVIVMLCVIIPWAHTNVPVKRDSLEMEKQVAHQ